MKKSLRNNSEVAHVWASQSQSEGYGSHFFFDGPSIYSYGRHFEVARIVQPNIVLFNSASYSVSTSRHQSLARRAVSHMKTFRVPSMTDHNENAKYLIKSLEDELFRISRMRKGSQWALEQYVESAETAWEYAALFTIREELFDKIAAIYKQRENPLSQEQMEKLKARAAANRERQKQQRIEKEKRDALRKAELQTQYDAWKNGEIASLPSEAQSLFPVALRITTDSENENYKIIQTSRGASVTVDDAVNLYHALMESPDVSGMRVGHYTVTGVRDADLIIGCHIIPLSEVARISRLLNLQGSLSL